jgi:hypothetical protein
MPATVAGDPRVARTSHSVIDFPASRANHPERSPHPAAKPLRPNGARFPIWRVTSGWRQVESIDVKPGNSAASDPRPPAPTTAKWRFKRSEKRHLAPFSTPFLSIFSEFFCELPDPGANWRESYAQKR